MSQQKIIKFDKKYNFQFLIKIKIKQKYPLIFILFILIIDKVNQRNLLQMSQSEYPQNLEGLNKIMYLYQINQEANQYLHLQQFDINLPKQILNTSSTNNQMDYQSQENEENYVSVRDFTEINSTSQSVNKSQLENLLFKTERHKQCGLQPLNSTILPKINLCEKQQENASKESIIRQPNRNLSKQIRKTSYVQIRPTKTSIGANLEPKEREGSIQDSFLCNQNTINKAINQRRRSSRMQVEQFQNTLLKMIQDKTSNQQEQKQKMLDIPDQNETLQTQEQEKSQIQNQVGEEQSCKLDTIQKLKKKDDKLKNSFVSRLGIFQRFIRNIKNLSQSYKFRIMKAEQKLRFNDLSFYQQKNKEMGNQSFSQKILFRIFSKVFQKLANQIPVFEPLHLWVICLELIVLITLTAQLFTLPLADSFDVNYLKQGGCKVVFYYIPAIALIISIFSKLNTGFFKENIAVHDRKKIFLNYYYSGELMIDLITVLSFFATQDIYDYVFLLLKIYQIQNSIVKVDTKFSLSQRFPLSFQIFKLIFIVMILAHLNGCIFHQVAKNVDESWITKNNLKTANWYEQYINSVYFSFITMVTVGYGDITPVSLQEKVFVIFMVVYSCGFFGYIVSSIGNIFTQRAQIQANYKRQLVDMIQYMKTRNISQVIQQQVFQYLHYLEQMDYYNHQKGEEIVKKLSPYLQQQININSYYPFLKSSNYFKLNFKDTILINASLKMKELTFGPGQIIFKQNDQDNRLFYILKGEVQLSSNNHQICIKDENDNCFGINEFFTGECRNLEAKSLTVSQILYLELNEFKQVLKEDPLEYEKFCSLKDQVIFSKISIDQPCFFCNKFSHRYDQCPFYTLKNQRLLVIEKSNRSISQERKQFERYDRFKFNSVLENAEVKLNLRAIRLNYINNLAIDKNEMIQLAQDTIQIENDVDFYRYNDAFQLKQNSEGQDFNIILVSSDKIADEFFLEEEKLEYGEEGNDQLNPIINSQKKVATSQTIATESLIEENKNQLQPALQNSQNQHRKSISFLQNAFHTQNSSNLNTYNYEKLQTIKEQFSTTNHRIQNHTRQQSSRKNSDISISSYQNKNAEPSPSKVQEQNLLKQILNLIELTQIKQEVENKHEVSFFIQKDEFFCINDFDQLQEFTRYFPKSNFSQVLGQISKTNLKKQKVPLKKAKKNQNKPRNTVFKNLAIKKKNILSKINTCRALANKHKKSQDTPLVIAKSSSYNQSNTESLSNALSCRTQEMQDFNIDQKSENKLLQSQQFDNVRSNFLKPQQ
ncbi:cyclic nucleotide-binding domain protein (macronuclear) [Tetrahymena thermophila SB210]|uniref:Cyclic nucleotide-binding domain protein n=1 Tax=Tetrahymena thermophila (strain SB210) TaxID=312017 RepID=Q23R03_TETTS|nr:cyclic nucleotide-binding domain protein [Tetrahymena thermophila SB210]EAR98953.3 cyclic nucleotide-binding domain protein [Tetrahymena thermophila SB210]|eukprot:XP_001019198.3 cyclic nucleotide-binding domain protein [Tetrahymena thermophila SB210]